jgi:hypothetical protein
MTQDANQHQAPIPRWIPQAPRSTDHQLLQRRIDELEDQIRPMNNYWMHYPSCSSANSNNGSIR